MGGREDGGAESVCRADRVSTFDCYHFIPAPGRLIIICCGSGDGVGGAIPHSKTRLCVFWSVDKWEARAELEVLAMVLR
jgi:hypothetical protein